MLTTDPFYVGPYLITPHPLAPHFSSVESASSYLPSVVSELQSSSSPSREGYSLIRELSLVSYYFFLNGILKFTGNYDGLDDSLSLDMMNFRQSSSCERPGAWAACFMPRGFSKSRVFTHGGTTWDLIRDPSERCLITNAIYTKAHEFLENVQANFTRNEVFSYFFPEYVPGKQGGTCTKDELTLPNRPSSGAEPSLRILGLTGAGEGGHYSLITNDDLVGLDALDQNHQATLQMGTARKWFNTNRYALRMTEHSRNIVVATRYAIDDCYSDIYSSCRSVTGWTKGDLQPQPNGEWDVYYRLVEEDGVYLRPNVMNETSLARLLETDYWAAMTQYYNSPLKSGVAEFQQYPVKSCSLVEDDEGRLWVRKDDPNLLDDDSERLVSLASCNLVIATDLAATDTNMNARTCRSAITVWLKDARENVYLLWSRVGFFSIFESLDHIFLAARIFRGHSLGTLIETNAFQKIMKPLLDREQLSRRVYINPIPMNASGDKKARIRAAFGISLARGKVYATADSRKPLVEELGMFPMSDSRLDTLDASEKAFIYLQRPESIEEREDRELREEDDRVGACVSVSGY